MAPDDNTADRNFYLGLFAACLIGLILRILPAFEPSIRIEEALYWTFATNLSGALQSTQPPLYAALLAGWIKVFGQGLLGIRLLSALLGAAGIFAAGLLGARIAGRSYGFIIALLFATCPILIFHGATATPFATLITLFVAVFWLLIFQLDQGRAEPMAAAAFTLAMVAGAFTHFLFWLAFPVMAIYVFFYRKNDAAQPGVKRQLIIGFAVPLGLLAIYSPVAWSHVAIYLKQQSQFASAIRFPGIKIIGWFEGTLFSAPYLGIGILKAIFALVTLGIICFGILLVFRKGRNVDATALLMFAGLSFFSLLVSAFIPIINEHLIGLLVPGVLLLIGLGIMGLGRLRWIMVAIFAVAGIAGIITNSMTMLKGDYSWRMAHDWKGLVQVVGERMADDEIIVVQPAWYSAPVAFHAQKDPGVTGKFGDMLPIHDISPGKEISKQDSDFLKDIYGIHYICAPGADCKGTLVLLEDEGFSAIDNAAFRGTSLAILRKVNPVKSSDDVEKKDNSKPAE